VPRWVPNAITVLRIVLIPLWWLQASACVEAAPDGDRHRLLAIAILVAIGISDMVDGFIARRFGLATPFGAVLDAVADKLAQIALLVFLTFFGGAAFASVPLGFFVLIIARDVVLAGGTLLVRARRSDVAVTHEFHGKLSSLLLFCLLFALTAGAPDEWTLPVFWGLGLVVFASTFAYVRRGWKQWRGPAAAG